ncbi:MAG TPA: HNH endonuclease signature motif containing protein, partial [Actinomycetota bacterium]
VRDHHCTFPECDRPASWCDAHHVIHWTDGGRTDLSNLVLLCRRHHVRHEAPHDRAEVKRAPPPGCRSSPVKLEAA